MHTAMAMAIPNPLPIKAKAQLVQLGNWQLGHVNIKSQGNWPYGPYTTHNCQANNIQHEQTLLANYLQKNGT
jgi:hypothetical protein